MLRYVLWLKEHCRYYDFAEGELMALLELSGIKDVAYQVAGRRSVILEVNAEDKVSIESWLTDIVAKRSINVKAVALLYSCDVDVASLAKKITARVETSEEGFGVREIATPDDLLTLKQLDDDIMTSSTQSFAWMCETSGARETLADHVADMNAFKCLFQPHHRTNLKAPGVTFCIFKEKLNPKSTDYARHVERPWVFVGRLVVRAERVSRPYELQDRPVLGPTTLDTDVSFLMCNMALVKKNSLVLDPFAGTCSLLIAAAALGAHCFGSDIDPRVIRGWGVAQINQTSPNIQEFMRKNSTNAFTNFKYYGLERPDLALADNEQWPWRAGMFDAIVTDPPYGIRAMTNGECLDTVFRGVLRMAYHTLRPAGRLVLLVPKTKDFDVNFAELINPAHFTLAFAPCCEQLNGGRARFCVCLIRNA